MNTVHQFSFGCVVASERLNLHCIVPQVNLYVQYCTLVVSLRLGDTVFDLLDCFNHWRSFPTLLLPHEWSDTKEGFLLVREAEFSSSLPLNLRFSFNVNTFSLSTARHFPNPLDFVRASSTMRYVLYLRTYSLRENYTRKRGFWEMGSHHSYYHHNSISSLARKNILPPPR